MTKRGSRDGTSSDHSPENAIRNQELLSRLYWSVVIRLVIITLLAGNAIFTYQYKIVFYFAPWVSPLIIILATLYAVSFVELIGLKKSKELVAIAYISSLWDAVFTSVLIVATGGIESIYTFLYLFVALEGGFLLSKKGGFIFSSVSSILYGLIVDAQFYGLLSTVITLPGMSYPGREILFNLVTYISTTYIVGMLSAFLGNSLLKAKQALSVSSTDLRHLTNLHSIIVNSIDSGLLTLDEHLIINSVNPATTKITGYLPGEIIGKKIDEIVPGIQLKAVHRKRNEMAIRKKDDGVIQIGYTASSLHDDTGRQVGTVITFQDLTEMKKMEARLKRADILATAGRFAASVAHEIRNPLASISGAVQLLIEDLKTEREFEKPLELIYRESSRINSLVTEFLTMSKPVTNIQEGVALKEIVDEVFDNVSRTVEFSPLIKLRTSIDGSVLIRADKLKMKQVLLNLISNAIHAIRGAGAIDVDCSIKNDRAIITLKDNGQGMDEHELKLSLEPFWTTTPGGTGLGLPVVQTIVEQHDGVMKISSKKGEGTTVTIKLPMVNTGRQAYAR